MSWVQECCEIDNIFDKGSLSFAFMFEWVGGMSLGQPMGSARNPVTKMENQPMRTRDKRLGD
jgi:hypothetical protein